MTVTLSLIRWPSYTNVGIYRMCKYKFPTLRLSKVIVWQTDLRTYRIDGNYKPRGWSTSNSSSSSSSSRVFLEWLKQQRHHQEKLLYFARHCMLKILQIQKCSWNEIQNTHIIMYFKYKNTFTYLKCVSKILYFKHSPKLMATSGNRPTQSFVYQKVHTVTTPFIPGNDKSQWHVNCVL